MAPRPKLVVVGDDWQTTDQPEDEHALKVDVHDPEAWTTVAPGGYARNKYYMKATDGHGHSDNVQVKLTPQINGMIGALIASGTTQYRTPQDLIRCAVVHRLHDMHQMGRADAIAGQLPEIIMQASMDQAAVERDARTGLCTRTAKEIEVLVGRGQADEVVAALDGLDAISGNWPEHDRKVALAIIAAGNLGLKRTSQP